MTTTLYADRKHPAQHYLLASDNGGAAVVMQHVDHPESRPVITREHLREMFVPIRIEPPRLDASTPSALGAALAEWAGDDVARLWGAVGAGNGRTLNCFLRRLSIPTLERLLAHIREHGTPLPHSTTAYGVWEIEHQLRRRSA